MIKSGQYQGRPLTAQQLNALRQQRDNLRGIRDLARNNPKQLKERIEQRRAELQYQLNEQRLKAETEVNTEAAKKMIVIFEHLETVYKSQNQLKEADFLAQQVLQMRKQENPDLASSLNNLAIFYRLQGKAEAAERLSLQAAKLD